MNCSVNDSLMNQINGNFGLSRNLVGICIKVSDSKEEELFIHKTSTHAVYQKLIIQHERYEVFYHH